MRGGSDYNPKTNESIQDYNILYPGRKNLLPITALKLCIRGIQIALIYLLLYYAVFLGVYFKTNYSSAEKADTALLLLTIMSAFAIDRGGINLDRIVINQTTLFFLPAIFKRAIDKNTRVNLYHIHLGIP